MPLRLADFDYFDAAAAHAVAAILFITLPRSLRATIRLLLMPRHEEAADDVIAELYVFSLRRHYAITVSPLTTTFSSPLFQRRRLRHAAAVIHFATYAMLPLCCAICC